MRNNNPFAVLSQLGKELRKEEVARHDEVMRLRRLAEKRLEQQKAEKEAAQIARAAQCREEAMRRLQDALTNQEFIDEIANAIVRRLEAAERIPAHDEGYKSFGFGAANKH